MPTPTDVRFFRSPAAFGRWLAANHAKRDEVWAGFHRKATGGPAPSLPIPGGPPRDFTIAEAGDGLTAQLEGQGAGPLIHYGDHTFGADFDPSVRLIFTVEGNQATKLVLLQGGRRLEAPRR